MAEKENEEEKVYFEYTGRKAPHGVTHVVVQDGVTEIAPFAFNIGYNEDTPTIQSIKIPPSVNLIASDAFHGCRSLVDVQLSSSDDGLKEIGAWSFQECFALTTIKIPSTVTFIGDGAFVECTSLVDIQLPEEGLTEIGECCFFGCFALATIKIPDSTVPH